MTTQPDRCYDCAVVIPEGTPVHMRALDGGRPICDPCINRRVQPRDIMARFDTSDEEMNREEGR